MRPFVDVDVSAATAATTTTPPPTGMTANAVGDLEAFLSALVLNAGVALVCLGAFCVLRPRYPRVFSNNVLIGTAPSAPGDGALGWAGASLGTTVDQAVESIGLDNAMMLEFMHMSMKILATIGTPMLCILGPMHYFLGGNAAGMDRLSYLSLQNVENGSWLYWVHAFVVWAVVITVQTSVYGAQRAFLPRRMAWLRGMAEVRANTVLVENIPQPQQSNKALKEYFDALFPGDRVEAAYVAKHITKLEGLVRALSDAKKCLHEARFNLSQDPQQTPRVREACMGERVEAIPLYVERVASLTAEIDLERRHILASSSTPGEAGYNCCNGFVTFRERSDAELALRLGGISPDQEEWKISIPPEPRDIQWGDMTQDPTARSARTVIGYALVAGLYFAYLPCVLGITNLANTTHVNLGPLQQLWNGVVPTLGLQVMVALLPTFLINIFQAFFTLRAAAWAQHKLQIWYFWFQVVFVILASAVGQNFTGFLRTVLAEPLAVFRVLADTMPSATHFFMKFLALQWMSDAMNITRYVQLVKYKIFRVMYEAETARQMSEPEDQEFYGLGSRSARWTIMLSVGIVYGTLAPSINLLCFLNFALCRLIYGYLIPFAETRKPDLGGVFWVQMLRHMFVGSAIYCVLMTGVLYRRAATPWPTAIAAPSVLYVLWSMRRFDTAFTWERLPFSEVMHVDAETAKVKQRTLDGEYSQPELVG